MKITLVYNPKSGSALSLRALRAKFHKNDITVVDAIAIGPGFEKKLAKSIQEKGYIAAVGGDGTISGVTGVIAGTHATLIPLPGGTLNHFTKDLGIPQDIDEAITKLKQAKKRKIDTVTANDITFINNSSIGLYPQSLKIRESAEKRTGKWPAAVWGIIKAFIRFKTYEVTINDKKIITPFIFVGNNSYKLDNSGFTNRTSLNQGVLCVYLIRAHTRTSLVKLLFSALVGRLHNENEFISFTSKTLKIKTKRKSLAISHDGEVRDLIAPITYKNQSKSLFVFY